MSATEILNQLPALSPAELEFVFRRAVELRQGQIAEASGELLAAVDTADESFETEGGVSLDEARRILASWNTK